MKINVETVMKTLVTADIRYQLASWMITKQTRRQINNVIRRSDDISAALQLFYRFPKPLKISVLRPQDNNNKKNKSIKTEEELHLLRLASLQTRSGVELLRWLPIG